MLTQFIVWLEAPSLTIWAWRHRKDIFTKDELLNYSVTTVFVEHPLASPRSAKKGLLGFEILGLHFLTRSFVGGNNRHTNILTYRLNFPRGLLSWKLNHKYILVAIKPLCAPGLIYRLSVPAHAKNSLIIGT